MNHGMVKLDELIPGWGLPEPTPKDKPPHPKPPKVVGDPTREPVNRQAAMVTAKAGWLYQPPMPPAEPPKSEREQLAEENAKLRAANEQLVKHNSALTRRVERLTKLLEARRPELKPINAEPPKQASAEGTTILERLKEINR